MIKNKLFYIALISAFSLSLSVNATEINTNTAIMQAMDKITGHVSLVEVPVNQEVKFGTFSILVRECKTRTPEETPENFAFVDIVDATPKGNKINIFKGWMISSSPALNAVAHPVYDVWLLKCTDKNVDTKLQMNKEELADRDTIEMKRQQAIMVLEEVAKSENIVETSGEPIDLIPDSVTEENAETKDKNAGVEKNEILTPEKIVTEAENVVENASKDIKEIVNTIEDGAPEALVVIQEEKTSVPPLDEYEVIEDVVVIKNEQEQKIPSDNEEQNTQEEIKEQVTETVKKAEEQSEKETETTDNNVESVAEEIKENTIQKVDEEPKEKILSPEEIISQLEKELSAKAISE
ncbi:MAG: DUF2155 domain-containing protein [Alphaproteobacteria bacterium]|nr:DUF2155 domain-containing protein [Alphaproteobacteria bacterium]